MKRMRKLTDINILHIDTNGKSCNNIMFQSHRGNVKDLTCDNIHQISTGVCWVQYKDG